MVHHSARLLLLLLLTFLAGISANETQQDGANGETPYGPSDMEITGVTVVTVGIPYGFKCFSLCYPYCQYTWTMGNVTTQGYELNVLLQHVVPTQTLSCTVVNSASGKSATVQRMLQVTAGPSNIQISGPPMLTIGAPSTFTCSADCYPSCSYSWTVIFQGHKYTTVQGNTISVTPPASTALSETLICEAEDTVSHLYISTTLSLWVASSSDIIIRGEDIVTMGEKYTFVCTATCTPSCEFTWKYMGRTYKGAVIQIPILHQGAKSEFKSELEITFKDYSRTEVLTCNATNSLSQSTITATKNLTVIDPISVRPTSQARPIAGDSFSLQCAGFKNPESIIWLKNKQPIPPSDRVTFSPNNSTMNFSFLMTSDEGLYQCVVAEGGTPIQSVSYKMQVIYGPTEVGITGFDTLTVGTRYDYDCSASCYPPCQLTWHLGNETSKGPELSLQFETPQPPRKLTCTAVNPVTGASLTDPMTLQMAGGPKNVIISGPDTLEIGVTASFTCSAKCIPSCGFTWTVYGETVTGITIDITVNRHVSTESISCQAQNTQTGETATANRTLSVSDPHWCGC